MKVLAHEQPRPAKFDEVKDGLIQTLATSRGEMAFEDWLKQERERRSVEIFDEALELYGQAVGAVPASSTEPPQEQEG